MDVDLHDFLHVSNTGLFAYFITNDPTYNWFTINAVLRNSQFCHHRPFVCGFMLNAHVIQHVLRHNVIPKADDCISVTPLIFFVTYFYLTSTIFNVANLLIHYIENFTIIRNPNLKKKNLVLGYMIAYIFQRLSTTFHTSRSQVFRPQSRQRERNHLLRGSFQLTTITCSMLRLSILCVCN